MMITVLGHFKFNTDTQRIVSDDGVDWMNYANSRNVYDENGKIIEYAGTTFCKVLADSSVADVSLDPTTVVPLDNVVLETDENISFGMIYRSGRFEPAPPPPIVVYKDDILNSFTDEEFEIWDTKFGSATARQRVTWNSNSTFSSDQSNWQTIVDLFKFIFGNDGQKFLEN